MLDRDAFLRPIAHRGLHNDRRGLIENTLPAFEAALHKGYGIECDLRPAAGGLPIVFHDETLNRLVAGKGGVHRLTPADLKRLRYRGADTHIATFAELLDLVRGRVPLLVEIKSEWTPPNMAFLAEIARLSRAYRGPLALMSFDPAVLVPFVETAPRVPRGIVSGRYGAKGWWTRKISQTRAARLRDLLESEPVQPSFYAYDVSALPTPVTRYVREVAGLPLFTWTVRTERDRKRAEHWADAPIFEGFEPRLP
ncbi:MAG: glycerophosphodiester phosphodiesterase family protein [Hyphomicrobium sp.]